jgi:glycosyltransferase involved in cell wall biosynthesis
MEPVVSILIPTYKRNEEIFNCLRSIEEQTYNNIEIIISDNDPDNFNLIRIEEEFIKYPIFYSKNEFNIGPILNWRKAFELSNGIYCMILPDDDLLINPQYIEDSVGILEEQENIGVVLTGCILGYSDGSSKENSFHKEEVISGHCFRENFWKGEKVPTIANVFRKKLVHYTNAFTDNNILYSDIEFWLKSSFFFDFHKYKKPSVLYVFHENNIVNNMSSREMIQNSKIVSNIKNFILEKQFSCNYNISNLLYRYLINTIDKTNISLVSYTLQTINHNNILLRDFGIINILKCLIHSTRRIFK